MKDNLSKDVYLFILFSLFLSCNSKTVEKQMEEWLTLQKKVRNQKKFMEDVLGKSSIIKEGNIILQTSTSSQSRAIQLATKSKYSHVGIIFKDTKNDFIALEAVQTVKYTPLNKWIEREKNS